MVFLPFILKGRENGLAWGKEECKPVIPKLVGCDPPAREALAFTPLRSGEGKPSQAAAGLPKPMIREK